MYDVGPSCVHSVVQAPPVSTFNTSHYSHSTSKTHQGITAAPPPLTHWHPPICLLSPWICLVWTFPMQRIRRQVIFCVQLLLFHVCSGFVQVVGCIRVSFLSVPEYCVCVCVLPQSVYPFICWLAFGLCPSSEGCEHSCSDHLWTAIDLRTCFLFFWEYTYEGIDGSDVYVFGSHWFSAAAASFWIPSSSVWGSLSVYIFSNPYDLLPMFFPLW